MRVNRSMQVIRVGISDRALGHSAYPLVIDLVTSCTVCTHDHENFGVRISLGLFAFMIFFCFLINKTFYRRIFFCELHISFLTNFFITELDAQFQVYPDRPC